VVSKRPVSDTDAGPLSLLTEPKGIEHTSSDCNALEFLNAPRTSKQNHLSREQSYLKFILRDIYDVSQREYCHSITKILSTKKISTFFWGRNKKIINV
jgi:hypothetical protein